MTHPKSFNANVLVVIPARFASRRLPGKPLAKIGNKSLLQLCWENVSHLENVIIATDDRRIADHVKAFGGNVAMTSSDCLSGTDRIVETLKNGHGKDADIILNIQGDEPLIEQEVLSKVVRALVACENAVVATAISVLDDKKDAMNPSVVKCVVDKNGSALYFSRSLIPGNKEGAFCPPYFKHLGIYAYRKEFLLEYSELPPTPLQLMEDLEQLKILEHGYKIQTTVVKSKSIGIDTPEDLAKVQKRLSGKNC